MPQPVVLADYKDALTPYRSYRERYYCPVCNGHNLTFSPTGAWMCWNEPTREHRVEIMARLVPNFKQFASRVKSEPCPVIIPRIHPARLHFPLIKDEHLAETIPQRGRYANGRRTVYWYSAKQRVVRIDYRTDKVIFPQSFNGKEWLDGAGSNPWTPYGLSRLLPYPGNINLILVVEGQKSVEIAHSRGIPAFCLEAGDYSNRTAFDKLRVVKERLGRVLLVVLPDYDLAGTYKAERIVHTARYFSLPTLLLDPLQIESNLKVADDIEQMPSLDADRLLTIVKRMLSPPKQ
ncbi:hypothetical protein [Chamaesiphon minutus]|uniref:Toprim domain-containing protein n=1 Tax=Chamaesiphon minutus (strain ATCC 27169 / PCC 6605) TaxID=1173020 RepID=K9UQZ2_CHAP6|nr:hypothetical protein [Chamaesiphon minutus]AFY97103.1 hypothetical protein Cha6605_6277 [Chamaesiphon minutus PCC 6605]